jgi:hypothetical protein
MFHQLGQADAGAIIVLTRTGRRFQDAEQVEFERMRLKHELDALGRPGKRLLIDSRAAPLGTDQKMGEAFRDLRREIQRGFERIAVVLDSKVGVLQANRLASTDLAAGGNPTGQLCVFETEEVALEFLREGSAAAAARPSRFSIRPPRTPPGKRGE